MFDLSALPENATDLTSAGVRIRSEYFPMPHRQPLFYATGLEAAPMVALRPASTLAGNLHLNFEQYLHGALPDIRMQLTRTVDTELKKMAKEMQIDPRLLATTMLAISIDNDGRFVGVHLGDGSILWNVGSSDLLKTVSSPQRGDQPNSTYLTMNCPLFYYLRFYRWTKPGARRIILLSDGMNGLNAPLTSGIFSVQNQDLLNQKMINTRNFDDMSYVLCELDAPCSRQ